MDDKKQKINDGLEYVKAVLETIPVTDVHHCDMKHRAWVNVIEILRLINAEAGEPNGN
jgi:hypothetical protein